MPSQGAVEEPNRKRRVHKKSRWGCRNCKLRRVKCDEAMPQCKKCTTFGVSCNYDPNALDLQMTFDGPAAVKSSRKRPSFTNQLRLGVTLHPTGLNLYPTISDGDATFQLDGQTLDRLARFHSRTVLSIGNVKVARLYQKEIIKLVCVHPYLMHVVQTVTASHDRFLSVCPSSRQSIADVCHHWSRGGNLFNRKLSKPIHPDDRDALWAAAILLGIVSFAEIDASNPEEAWPLKSAETIDLDWLKMSDGKAAVWEVTDPLRPGSILHSVAGEYNSRRLSSEETKGGAEGVPSAFVELYGLSESSTNDNNPYHSAIHAVIPLLHVECNQSTIVRFLSFINHTTREYKGLLQQKDPRALLLLAYWYAKVRHAVWWVKRRATLECQATCLYLERYHAGEKAIQELLLFPKVLCGLMT